ncbi:MAG: fibrillarin-like rRNA/tRNA 2'-O-methyltransferase [Candidatus Diapherotrites archaeon]|nr:fibrillarin-like rRNA/tRNA 2'-O-methyltransferase [Candidatus Diapherotrites archaeon]
MKELFPNVFREGRKLFTLGADPKPVYGERVLEKGGGYLHEWDPFRSKLGAAIMQGLNTMPIKQDSRVLYLGAAQGTTPSHVSDICRDGYVVCVDVSQKAFEKLIPLSERRENMMPVLADANHPEGYAEYCDGIDVVYQDVAQLNQADILLKNVRAHLKRGYAMLAIKSRSIDVTKPPQQVFKQEIGLLRKEMDVVEVVYLSPFEKDHAMVVCEK